MSERRGGLLRSFKAVAWSFFGVRQASEYERDVTELKPAHVIVAGIISAAVFVVVLVLLVKWVVGSGVAT